MSVGKADIEIPVLLQFVRSRETIKVGIAWDLSLIRSKLESNVTQNYSCPVLQSNWVNVEFAQDLSSIREWPTYLPIHRQSESSTESVAPIIYKERTIHIKLPKCW
jgi:hypothetical protein